MIARPRLCDFGRMFTAGGHGATRALHPLLTTPHLPLCPLRSAASRDLGAKAGALSSAFLPRLTPRPLRALNGADLDFLRGGTLAG